MAIAVVAFGLLTLVLAVGLVLQHRRATLRHATDAAEIQRLTGELAAATELAATSEARATQSQAQADENASRAERAEANAEAVEAKLTAMADAHQVTAEEQAAVEAKLWRLELERSDRTWRHSVSVSPAEPSPLAEPTDALRAAVEIEAAALHEETGAPLTVRWQLEDPVAAPRLLVLRAAQELLAYAAHEGTEITLLAASAEGEVVLSLTPDDEGVALDRSAVSPHLAVISQGPGFALTLS